MDFPLANWPVAGKTGTAEKTGKADSAWFVGFGPATWPERGLRNTAEIVVAMVFEEAGFGGAVAARRRLRVSCCPSLPTPSVEPEPPRK